MFLRFAFGHLSKKTADNADMATRRSRSLTLASCCRSRFGVALKNHSYYLATTKRLRQQFSTEGRESDWSLRAESLRLRGLWFLIRRQKENCIKLYSP